MESAQKQLIEKLTTSTNILVTVSRDPSVDQLAACIGLTLILNKLDKHATAVFSGSVPSTLEFLKPEGTLEKNTDSLRDFIIALDKSKADKLRYKVEDQLVRIFITPYRTSISEKDLEFSQGDFNVDLVIALGVAEQTDLDEAITAHGRILHDATVSSINASSEGALGSINWNESNASSLCEMVGELAKIIGKDLLDAQIATALLTGIVAQTERFSNEKTTPETMSVSSELLTAGADQQLVATQLQPPAPVPEPPIYQPPVPPEDIEEADEPNEVSNDGTLEIEHEDDEAPQQAEPEIEEPAEQTNEAEFPEAKFIANPPPLSSTATAGSSSSTGLEQAVDPLGYAPGQAGELMERSAGDPPISPLPAWVPPSWVDPATVPASSPVAPEPVITIPEVVAAAPPPQPVTVPVPLPEPAPPKVYEPLLTGFTPPPPAWVPPTIDSSSIVTPEPVLTASEPLMAPDKPISPLIDNSALKTDTLQRIEEAVHSPHLQTPNVDDARDEVQKALEGSEATPEPIQALNAQPLGEELHHHEALTLTPPTMAAPTLPSFEQSLQQTIPAISATTSPEPIVASPHDDALASFQLPPVQDLSAPLVTPPPVAPPIVGALSAAPGSIDPAANAPTVPPPIPYRFGNSIDAAQAAPNA